MRTRKITYEKSIGDLVSGLSAAVLFGPMNVSYMTGLTFNMANKGLNAVGIKMEVAGKKAGPWSVVSLNPIGAEFVRAVGSKSGTEIYSVLAQQFNYCRVLASASTTITASNLKLWVSGKTA